MIDDRELREKAKLKMNRKRLQQGSPVNSPLRPIPTEAMSMKSKRNKGKAQKLQQVKKDTEQ